MDALCVLPFIGWVLWWLPLLWNGSETPIPSSTALVYLFATWLVLSVFSFWLVRQLLRARAATDHEREGGGT